MNNLDYKPELEYDIWQPSEIKGKPDLNVTIRLVPITERAEQRVEEYGDVMKLMNNNTKKFRIINDRFFLVLTLL